MKSGLIQQDATRLQVALTLSRADALNFWSKKALGSICPGGLPIPERTDSRCWFHDRKLSRMKAAAMVLTDSQSAKFSVPSKMVDHTHQSDK